MTGAAVRIRDEAVRYAAEMQSEVAGGVYSSGIEMGLAIAIAAGPDASGILAELRELVYHGERDRWVFDEMDREAAAIAGRRLA